MNEFSIYLGSTFFLFYLFLARLWIGSNISEKALRRYYNQMYFKTNISFEKHYGRWIHFKTAIHPYTWTFKQLYPDLKGGK